MRSPSRGAVWSEVGDAPLRGLGCPARGGACFRSPRLARGWSAKRRYLLQFCRAPLARNAGASRRSIVAISVPGAVASGRGRGPRGPPIRQAFARLRPRRVQPTEGQSPVVGTDGDPGPPECEVTSLARGRHHFSRFSSVLQERPSVEKVEGI